MLIYCLWTSWFNNLSNRMGESNERPCSAIENWDRSGTDPTLLASDWFLTGPGTLHCIIGLMPGQCHCVWGSGLFSLMYTPSHINGSMYMRVWVCVYLRICTYLCYFFCVCVCLCFFCFWMLQLHMYVYAYRYLSACWVCTCMQFSKCARGMFRSRVFVGVYVSPTIWLSRIC